MTDMVANRRDTFALLDRLRLRECPLPEQMLICDTTQKVADYWRLYVGTNPHYNPECECCVVLMLNTRRRAKGHRLLTIGTLDTLLVHLREVFRGAIIASPAAIVLIHNSCVAAQKLCYVTSRIICSACLAALTFLRLPRRKECYGFA